MTVSGLDFRNPVGAETFNCFKRVCIFERNTNESSSSDPCPKVQNAAIKKVMKPNYNVLQQEENSSGSETEPTVYSMVASNPKPWNPPSGLKFPCPMADHKHEVSTCADFFALSPLDRWEKIDKGRMCFSCLKPKTICRSRKCTNYRNVPEVLKCTGCASWAESKRLAPFSIFFCKRKEHGESRALVVELKRELEKYLGKLGTTIVDSKIQFAVNFMFQNTDIKESSQGVMESGQGVKIFLPVPTFDSESGLQVVCQEENVCSEISESSIFLMQNLRIGNSDCLTFFDSRANAHRVFGRRRF